MTHKQLIRRLRIALVVLLLILIWLFFTVWQLQHDHTVMCSNVAQTIGANYANWGC